MEFPELKNYDKVALIYPHLMRSIQYDKWAEYIYAIVRNSVGRNDSVLELASGNGKMADQFKKYFPQLIISDLSFNMLSLSENRLKKICCDMTAIPLKTNFKLIYSAFDSVNYITSKKKLFQMFEEIKRLLCTNGIFTFDVSLETNSLNHPNEPLRSGSYNGINYIQKSEYSHNKRLHKNKFEIKIDDEIFYEEHNQKIFSFEEYFLSIEKAGLYVEECYDAFTFNDGNSECERVQFVVRN
jgi:ubiquinone/menaquinone biosynthesis C-methylase UbiE